MKHSVAGIVHIDSLFLIARRLPQGAMGDRWEFPGGKVEEGETFQEALKREFLEEFAMHVDVGSLITEAEFEHKGQRVLLHAFEVAIPEDNISWILSEHTAVSWAPMCKIETLRFVDSDLLLLPGIKKWVLD